MYTLELVRATLEYARIAEHYGQRTALRSRVPLINHIDEGLRILIAMHCRLPSGKVFHLPSAAAAFCLHPLLQDDEALYSVGWRALQAGGLDPVAIALAMEYRNKANAWLSGKVPDPLHINGRPDPGTIPEVEAMLVADKVQNYQDFRLHHAEHPRATHLTIYFEMWLQALKIDRELLAALEGKAKET